MPLFNRKRKLSGGIRVFKVLYLEVKTNFVNIALRGGNFMPRRFEACFCSPKILVHRMTT